MKCRIAYVLVMLFMICGCADDSYMGALGELYGVGNQSIPVLVSYGDPAGGMVKGGGAIDSVREWQEGTVYVYAFGQGEDVDYRKHSSVSPYECLVDASKSEPGSPAGRKAFLEAKDSYARWMDDEDVYYPTGKYRRMTYDFFSYFIDDIAVTPDSYIRTADSVAVMVAIDGTQDVMHSKAEVTGEQLEPFSEMEQEMILGSAYGYYTAQRNIVPIFDMKHMLVRLEFELIPGVVKEENKIITVHSVDVESRYKASFVVAAKDSSALGLKFENTVRRMRLTEDGGVKMEDEKYIIHTRPSSSVKAEAKKIGACILAAPDMEYNAYITMTEIRDDGSMVAFRAETPVLISFAPETFEAGNQYKVKLTIYGANQISMSVEMEKWQDGGRLDVDLDKEMENR